MSDPTKVGVIGVGKMGALHLQKYLLSPKAEVVGIWDENPQRLHSMSQQFGVPAYRSLAELLFDVDAASVATPTRYHHTIAREALVAGVHLLVEKPLAMSWDQARELTDLAVGQRLVLQTGFLERFRFREFRPYFPSLPIQMAFGERCSSAYGNDVDLDVISDLMIHDLDLALFLGEGEPLLQATGRQGAGGVYDVAYGTLTFTNLKIHLHASRVAEANLRRWRFVTESGITGFDLMQNKVFHWDNHRRPLGEVRLPPVDALALQCEDFLGAVREGRESWVGGQAGGRAAWLVERIRESADSAPGFTSESVGPLEVLGDL